MGRYLSRRYYGTTGGGRLDLGADDAVYCPPFFGIKPPISLPSIHSLAAFLSCPIPHVQHLVHLEPVSKLYLQLYSHINCDLLLRLLFSRTPPSTTLLDFAPHNVSLLRPLITPGQAGRHLVEGNAPPLRVQSDVPPRRRRPDVVLSTSLLSHRLRRWQAVPGQRAQGLGCPHDPVNVESKLEVVQSINSHKTKPEDEKYSSCTIHGTILHYYGNRNPRRVFHHPPFEIPADTSRQEPTPA